MSTIPSILTAEQISAFRQALADCTRIYEEGVEASIEESPERIGQPLEEFREQTRDLAFGLVLKIFVEIGQSDWRWSTAERLLAIELFDYIWGQRLDATQVRVALETIIDKSRALSWTTLVRPFERLPAFRSRVAELEAQTTRLAQFIAEIDGPVGLEESRHINHIQCELDRLLRSVNIDHPPGAQEPAWQPYYGAGEETEPQVRVDNSPALGDTTKPRAERLAEALGELDKLIGLDNIKREIEELVNFLKVEDLRAARGLPRTGVSLHMTFRGNPGTGKTSVARLLGKIYGAMGILSKGHLVETDRSGLVAQYVGQTGPKTQKKIDEALDGVLFIDEAYTLISDAREDAYGEEAVQTLLKRMEDDRSRIIVVLAGYPEPMDRLIAANPGLQSRFTRDLSFADYAAAELGRIFEKLCVEQHYTLSPEARLKLLVGFQYLLDHRDEKFGNARLARNLFETAIRRLANRVVSATDQTNDLLMRLEPGDLVLDKLPPNVWAERMAAVERLVMTCPGCRQPARFAPKLLGHSVHCNRCGQRFLADWGEIATR